MTKAKFECFKAEKKSALAECLRGRVGEEECPDISSIDSAESLKEQFYWFSLGINQPPEDDIDWKGLEKELRAYADKVTEEWHERKRSEDRAEAFRSGRL